METEEIRNAKVHHGHNVRRVRREKGLNQDVLAESAHVAQQTISRYESMKEIDDEMLERFAKGLGVSAEYLKTLEEDAPMLIFENNTVENQPGAAIGTIGAVAGNDNNMTTTNHFDPIEKITELYERLLSEEKAKNEQLQQRLLTIEEKLEGIR